MDHMEEDLLKPLPYQNWFLLRDSLKRDWPKYAYSYIWINNMIKWKQKDPNFKQNIYCPNGTYESGVFVATSTASLYIIIIFAVDESRELLLKVLKETQIIDWKRSIMFAAVHENFRDTFLHFIEYEGRNKRIKLEVDNLTKCYFRSCEDCSKITVKVPQECKLKPLELSHVRFIHTIWPHRSAEQPDLSFKFLELGVKYNKGIGLFMKKDDSLAAWIMHDYYGGLGMLQTLDQHKRKGYGKIVTQALAKELASEENLDSVLFIVSKNAASEKLFITLAYSYITTATWFHTKPNDI